MKDFSRKKKLIPASLNLSITGLITSRLQNEPTVITMKHNVTVETLWMQAGKEGPGTEQVVVYHARNNTNIPRHIGLDARLHLCSYNEPLTKEYFSHVAYDDYPVVGVTWAQAKAFCQWRTKRMNSFQEMVKNPGVMDYRLPSEVEWEYAARGGHQMTLYPWGSYYTRNQQGSFVGNYKPMRGNYVSDSRTNVTTMKVANYIPNSYGLYDMAGNVAEWTSNAYDESAYQIISDFSP